MVHHHKPDLGTFKRTALLLLAITLVPTAVMYILFPGTFWVVVPLFVSSFVLMQERFGLGKHTAWVTNQRIIWQGGGDVALSAISKVDMFANAVRIRTDDGEPSHKIYYAKDRRALCDLIDTTRGGTA